MTTSAALAALCLTLLGSDVRLNQIQVVGSHNSYHIAPAPGVAALIAKASPKQAKALAYSHRPLAEQFSKLGIRQIELDVYPDRKGGRYAAPKAYVTLKALRKDAGPDPDPTGALKKPGLKVLHVPDVDYQTTAPTFVDALQQVRDWSRTHPKHVPIFVLVELKGQADEPFDGPALDGLDAEIRSVFQPSEFLSPDDVRGDHATLPEALRRQGWPTLDAARGKVMFALDNEDAIRNRYLDGHPALKGRCLFVSVPANHPAAAWMKVNDAVTDFDRIQRLVRDGFLVRTRADADTTEARANDPSCRDKALASGAQFVSTDYAEPDFTLSPYLVRLPGGVVARLNPVSGDFALSGVDLELAMPAK
jgi:Phosphoinositide phospholipase C, Ca2+-dependent